MKHNQLLVLATTNTHKAAELQVMIDAANLPYQVATLADVGFTQEIDETGTTFEENAYIKAVTVHRATGLPVLADDSGLEVDLLDGAPGVRSARYAGPGATDADNRSRLKSELMARNEATSTARFRCVICVVDNQRTLLTEGTSTGHVVLDERGTQGFGYDAMFIPVGSNRTYGEMMPSEKLQTSHRGSAMQTMLASLAGDPEHLASRDDLPLRSYCIDVAVAVLSTDTTVLEAALRRVPVTYHHSMYEIILQSYLFGGFPTALDALQTCYRVFGAPPRDGDVGAVPAEAALLQRGELLCKEIYGHVYDKMMNTLRDVSPDLARWMILEGYGKTLARPGIDTETRELCIVAMLTILGRQQQLVSHVRGALRVGATLLDLRDVEHAVTEAYGSATGRRLLDLILLQEARLANQ